MCDLCGNGPGAKQEGDTARERLAKGVRPTFVSGASPLTNSTAISRTITLLGQLEEHILYATAQARRLIPENSLGDSILIEQLKRSLAVFEDFRRVVPELLPVTEVEDNTSGWSDAPHVSSMRTGEDTRPVHPLDSGTLPSTNAHKGRRGNEVPTQKEEVIEQQQDFIDTRIPGEVRWDTPQPLPGTLTRPTYFCSIPTVVDTSGQNVHDPRLEYRKLLTGIMAMDEPGAPLRHTSEYQREVRPETPRYGRIRPYGQV